VPPNPTSNAGEDPTLGPEICLTWDSLKVQARCGVGSTPRLVVTHSETGSQVARTGLGTLGGGLGSE
jgi:hypothetical protein